MDNEIIKCVMVPSRAAFIPGNKRELGGGLFASVDSLVNQWVYIRQARAAVKSFFLHCHRGNHQVGVNEFHVY